jgi:hypothetical protein
VTTIDARRPSTSLLARMPDRSISHSGSCRSICSDEAPSIVSVMRASVMTSSTGTSGMPLRSAVSDSVSSRWSCVSERC